MIRNIYKITNEIGGSLLFLKRIVLTGYKNPCSLNQIYEQIWSVTQQTLVTTALAGFFVGAIMTVQFSLQVSEFGALGYLGGLATSGTVREVGPLLIAFMLSGKVGAFTSAELGTMKVTEQIDAIRCLGADPIQEIILPRFIGIIVSGFFLLAVGLMMSVGGGLLLGIVFSKLYPEEYIRHIPNIVTGHSIMSGLVKSFSFSFILATICTYKGYMTTGGAKGVGQSVVSTAVYTMVSIVVMDWVTSLLGDTILKIYLEI